MHNSEPRVLGFDTSGGYCAAALVSGREVLTFKTELMARGQAERLMGLLQDVLDEAGQDWGALDRIGVGIGPGNFTGIRISVAAARGLALGLGIPAIGVTSFDAILQAGRPGVPAVPAPRGQAYLAPAGRAPYLASEAELLDLMEDGALLTPQPETIAMQIALCAAACSDPSERPAPAPLYIKPADAAPPRDAPPAILDA